MGVDYCEQVLRAGSNLVINTMGVDYLVRLARAARESGTHLTIVGAMGVNYMVQVAQAGVGHVTFDVAQYPSKN